MLNTFAADRGLIRMAREKRGIGVRQLARMAGVTPGAVTQWEASEAAGTMRGATLERALQAMGTTVAIENPGFSLGSLERREDRVALELHRSVALKLIEDPASVLSVVPNNVKLMRTKVTGKAANQWLDDWLSLSSRAEIGKLIEVMLGVNQRAIAMRQTSPFLGVLTQPERLDAIDRASREAK